MLSLFSISLDILGCYPLHKIYGVKLSYVRSTIHTFICRIHILWHCWFWFSWMRIFRLRQGIGCSFSSPYHMYEILSKLNELYTTFFKFRKIHLNGQVRVRFGSGYFFNLLKSSTFTISDRTIGFPQVNQGPNVHDSFI